MHSNLRILALGSPHGDDRVAWDVAENLLAEANFAGRVHKLATPIEIVEFLHADAEVLVVDSCVSGAPMGTVRRFDGDALTELPANRHSTHGGSLADALRLAESLGRRPANLTVLVVEIAPPISGTEPTQTGRECVRRLDAAVRNQLGCGDVLPDDG